MPVSWYLNQGPQNGTTVCCSTTFHGIRQITWAHSCSQYGSDFSTGSSEGEAPVKKQTRKIETYLRIPGTADDRTGQEKDSDSEHTGEEDDSDSRHSGEEDNATGLDDNKSESLHREKKAPTTATVNAEQQNKDDAAPPAEGAPPVDGAAPVVGATPVVQSTEDPASTTTIAPTADGSPPVVESTQDPVVGAPPVVEAAAASHTASASTSLTDEVVDKLPVDAAASTSLTASATVFAPEATVISEPVVGAPPVVHSTQDPASATVAAPEDVGASATASATEVAKSITPCRRCSTCSRSSSRIHISNCIRNRCRT